MIQGLLKIIFVGLTIGVQLETAELNGGSTLALKENVPFLLQGIE